MGAVTARIHHPGSSSCKTIRDFSVSTESTVSFSEKLLESPANSVRSDSLNTHTGRTSVCWGRDEVTWQIPPSPEPGRLASASHSCSQHSHLLHLHGHFPV